MASDGKPLAHICQHCLGLLLSLSTTGKVIFLHKEKMPQKLQQNQMTDTTGKQQLLHNLQRHPDPHSIFCVFKEKKTIKCIIAKVHTGKSGSPLQPVVFF